MKKIIITLALLFICRFSIAQSPIEFYYEKPDSALVLVFTGTQESVDSINDVFNTTILPMVYMSPGYARNDNGEYMYTGDLVTGKYHPDAQTMYASKISKTSNTTNRNVLEEIVYDKAECDARYKTVSYVPSWSDITSKPTIPTNTNQLTNGSGYITSEVDGSITNEIQTLSISGQSLSITGTGGNTVTLPSSAVSVSAPTAGISITSGTAFQPSSTNAYTINISSTLSATVVGLTGLAKVEYCSTQSGTYTEYSSESMGVLALSGILANTGKCSQSITLPAGYWVKVTLTKDTLATSISATYTKVTY